MNKTNTSPTLPQRRSNMPVTLMHHLQFAAAWTILGLFRAIGIDASSFIAGKFLRLLGPRLRKISRRGENNLRRVYPEWNDHQIRKTIADVWENLGRVGGEFAHLDRFKTTWDETKIRTQIQNMAQMHTLSEERVKVFDQYKPAEEKARIELDVSEDFLKVMAMKEPVIFVAGHMANWEVMSVVCGYFDIPCAIVYRASNNPLIDEMIIKKRGSTAPHWQIPKGPDGARAFIDALKEKYSLALMMDQKFNAGISVPFLGHDAMTAHAPARMMLNYDLPIIPVTVKRTTGARFIMKVHDRIQIDRSDDLQKDMKTITMQINQTFENAIREEPGQWLWLHRRWG